MSPNRSVHDRRPVVRPLVLALSTLLPLSAAAQQAPAAKDPVALDALTVTAQRRVENAKDVPVAITAIQGEKLDVLGSAGDDIRFLAGRVPSLNIESSYGRAFPRFYIRGLGNTDFDLNASQPVSLVYDDVVQESPLLKGFPLFDLAGVEVLRGPQGTLFGRNTPAGVVKFDSARPSQDADGYVKVAYGSYDGWNVQGAYGGPLTDRWSARVSALYQRRDDWVTNTRADTPAQGFEGYDEGAARVQFLYEGEDFEGLFNLHKRKLNGTARLFRANIIQPGTNKLVENFDRDEVATDGENFSDLETWGGSARLKWDLGRVTLHSITGYETAESLNHGDIDGGYGASFLGAGNSGPGFIPFPSESADGLPSHRQWTQEFRVESNEWGRFDWQAGVFYFDEDVTIDSFNYDSLTPGNPQTGHAVQQQRNKAWAAFASGDFDVTAYARVAKGFRAPSIQGRLAFGGVTQADSEKVISYEAGIKADLFDRRARLGVSVFRYDVDGQQLIAVGGSNNTATLLNADKTLGQGVELDFEAYLTDNVLLTLGSSYNDTEIKDRDLAVAICGGGCTITDPTTVINGGTYALVNGNSLPQAPKWIHNLTLRAGFPVDDASEFYVYTDWAYKSEVNFFLYESPEFRSRSSLEGGLRLGYNWDYGQYDVAVFGRNLTDQVRVVGAIDFNNLTGFINEPRTFGVEFTAKF
jgi:iron complex outermembrane receptor protein